MPVKQTGRVPRPATPRYAPPRPAPPRLAPHRWTDGFLTLVGGSGIIPLAKTRGPFSVHKTSLWTQQSGAVVVVDSVGGGGGGGAGAAGVQQVPPPLSYLSHTGKASV